LGGGGGIFGHKADEVAENLGLIASNMIKFGDFTSKTSIKMDVAYGSEVWTITGRTASVLMTWEQRILRRVYRPICEK
jgi:hypothetical protein